MEKSDYEYINPSLTIVNYIDELKSKIDIYTENQLKRTDENMPLEGWPVEKKEEAENKGEGENNNQEEGAAGAEAEPEGADEAVNPPEKRPEETYGIEARNDPYNKLYTVVVDPTQAKIPDPAPGTKFHDYMNSARQRILDQMKEIQEEVHNDYKMSIGEFSNVKADEINVDKDQPKRPKLEALMGRLFAKQFCFLVKLDQVLLSNNRKVTELENNSPFKMVLVVTDFFLNKESIELLAYNCSATLATEKINTDAFIVHLISYYIRGYLSVNKYNNEIIHIKREDLFNRDFRVEFEGDVKTFELKDLSLDLSKLKSFSLLANDIENSIELDLSLFANLEFLKLSFIKMDAIKTAQCTKIRHLYLDSCQFSNKSLKFLSNLPNVEYLEIRSCYLDDRFLFEDLNLDFSSLVNLKWLILEYFFVGESNLNLLSTLSKELVVLHLQNLHINSKHLDDFFKTTDREKLKRFKLRGIVNLQDSSEDSIESVEFAWFKNFTGLKELDLSWNSTEIVKTSPEVKFPHLEVLDLSQNWLTTITKEILTGFENLTRLDLSENPVAKIEHDAFENLPNLKELDLSYDFIKELHEKTFIPLKNLEFLNLRENMLNEINANYFDGLNNLKELYLYKNKMKELDPSMRYLMSAVRDMNIREEGEQEN